MRRMVALLAALVLTATLASAGSAAGPTSRVNHLVANFDILDWDGSVVGHLVADYKEPTADRFVPGRLDVAWVGGARLPYGLPAEGIAESHTLLVWAGFGPGTPGPVETGTNGTMCDYVAAGTATCHEFQVMFEQNYDGLGTNLVGFGVPDWENNPAEWYKIGRGSFVITYAGPTGN